MTSRERYEERILALAGLVQAAQLVSMVARTGLASLDSLEGSLKSIFVTNPAKTSDVYGGKSGVALGIKVATAMILHFNLADHADVLRYTFALLQLERKLARHPDCLRELATRITKIDVNRLSAVSQASLINEDLVAELAELYHSTLGNFEPRIRVQGKQVHLQNPSNISRIRALLLAGLRSAVLWHQLGGRRWHLMIARKPLVHALSMIEYS